MNHTILIARFAARLCARFTVLYPYILPAQDSTQQTNSYAQPVDNPGTKRNQRESYPHA